MAFPENYWPRRGDRIVITGTVNYDVPTEGTRYVFLDVGIGDNTHEIGIPFDIAKAGANIVRRGWRIGDRVFNELEQIWGTVAHVDGEWVCVKATKVGDPDAALGLYVWTSQELEPWPPEPGPAPGAQQPPPPTGW